MSFDLTGFGEVLPRWENFVETDPEVKDISGIPVLRIHMANGENEREMIRDMGDSAGETLEAAGARNVRTHANPSDPRLAVHEAGTARMGKDPKKSVLNEFQQSHDHSEPVCHGRIRLHVEPCQNPTLTIMALCVRSCDYLLRQMEQNAL